LLTLEGVSPATAGTVGEARKIDCRREERSFSPIPSADQESPAEPQRAFLLRAAVQHELVERGEIDAADAFDGLVEAFSDIVGFPACATCGAQPCVNPSFCAACRLADQRLAQQRRRR
jgi:hypothetical protein